MSCVVIFVKYIHGDIPYTGSVSLYPYQ